jgi:cation:H+ antiporter
LISGQAVLSHATSTDIYIACLGVLLTSVYICGIIFRSTLQILSMGVDSLIVLILYVLGILGLAFQAH